MNDRKNTFAVLADVLKERARQDVLWGIQEHDPEMWLTILGEEFGEVCRAVLEWRRSGAEIALIREEIVQVAAVAVAMIENLDISGWKYDEGEI